MSAGAQLLLGPDAPAQAARAEQIRAIVRTVIGDPPPAVAAVAEDRRPAPKKLLSLQGNARARPKAEKLAHRILDALLNRTFDVAAAHLHPATWMLWPDGQLSKHDTPSLLEALDKSASGAAAPLIAGDPRSYNTSEMRGVFPRGVPEALEKMFDAQNMLVLTFVLEGRAGIAGTAMMVMSPDANGELRAHNLILPALDHAVRASAPASPSEDEAIRFADRIVRHFVLGHDRHLRALRNHFHDRILIGEELAGPERVVDLAAFGPDRFEAREIIFGGSSLGALEDLASVGALDRVKRKTKELWNKPLEKLQLKVVKTKIDALEALSIMIGVKEPAREVIRWRLAGLFR